MGNEKDISEKTLQSFNDVFADIVNVLLFQGKKVVKENELEQSRARSPYSGEKGLREQERDEAKFWKNENIRIALCGFENETEEDSDMPIRVIGYDGASYRDQLYTVKDKNGKSRRNTNKRYPVVTLVLYFGMKHWKAPTTLHDNLKEIDKEMKPYVNDYKINLFEIAWLSDEQIKLFRSDFRLIAEFFSQKRKNKDYIPTAQQILHVKEFLNLMKYLTKDNRYREMYDESIIAGKEICTMCEILDKAEERGEKRGIEKGIEKGELLKTIHVSKRKLSKGKNLEEIADMLEENIDLIKMIIKEIQNNPQKEDKEICEIIYPILTKSAN